MPSTAQPLAGLRDRLLAHRAGDGSLALDASTLPSDAPDAAGLLELVSHTLGTTSLRIASAQEPALHAAPDRLELSGTVDVLGGEKAPLQAAFSLDANGRLQAVLRIAMPAGWSLAQAFTALEDTGFDHLRLADARFVVSSFAHHEDPVFFELAAGLNFVATLQLPSAWGLPAAGAAGARLLSVAVGGPIDTSGAQPQFRFTAEKALERIAIGLLGRPPVQFDGGRVVLEHRAGADAACRLDIEGTVDGIACIQQFPSEDASQLALRWAPGTKTPASVQAALAELAGEGEGIAAYFPASLLGLAGLAVRSFGYRYDRAGRGSTLASMLLEPSVDAGWEFVAGKPIRGLQIALEVRTARLGASRSARSFAATVRGKLQSPACDVELSVPSHGPWMLALNNTGRQPLLEMVAALVGAQGPGGSSIKETFPEFLRPAFEVSLDTVGAWFDPFESRLERIAFVLGQTAPWSPIPGVTVSGWSLSTQLVAGAERWSVEAILEGELALGTSPSPPKFSICMALPPCSGMPLELRMQEGTVVKLSGIGALFGALPAAPVLPSGLAGGTGVEVRSLAVSVDLAPAPALHSLSFALAQTGAWHVIDDQPGGPGLPVSGLGGTLTVVCRADGSWAAQGACAGMVTIGGVPVAMSLAALTPSADWQLRIAGNGVRFTRASEAEPWLSFDTALQGMPPEVRSAQGFTFEGISLVFGRADGRLKSIAFALRVDGQWTLLEAPHLSISNLRADARLPWPLSAGKVHGSVGGVLTLGDAPFALLASKPAADAHWEIDGELQRHWELDYAAAASGLGGSARLPAPPEFADGLRIVAARLRAVPETGMLSFAGAAEMDWSFDVAAIRATLRGLCGRIEIEKKGATPHLGLGGTLVVGSLQVDASLDVGGAGAGTVLRGRLMPQQKQSLSMAGMADTLLGAKPADGFAGIAPQKASTWAVDAALVQLDLGREEFAFCGRRQGLGWLALLVARHAGAPPQASAWECLFAVALDSGFKFGDLDDGLGRAVDGVLTVEQAGLLVFKAAAGTPGPGLFARLAAIVQDDAALRCPLPADALPMPADGTGAWFFGVLQFSATSVFRRLLEIGDEAHPPKVALRAAIVRGSESRTLFVADVPDITLFGSFRLIGLKLRYAADAGRRFELAGRLALHGVFGKDFDFDGSLVVTDQAVDATLGLAQDAAHTTLTPFELPGIAIDELKAVLHRDFTLAGEAGRKVEIRGKARFGHTPAADAKDTRVALSARLLFVRERPVLALIELDQDLSIHDFLQQCLPTVQWPSAEWIDLTFLAARGQRPGSRIYYCGSADAGQGFKPGFHVDAEVDLTLVTRLPLRIRFAGRQDPATRAWAGLEGQAGLRQAIDMGFLQLAGEQLVASADGKGPAKYDGGPSLAVAAGSAGKQFAFQTGINFLGKGLAKVGVQVGRDPNGLTVLGGQLQTADKIPVLGFALDCRFTYTIVPGGANRFRIDKWPDFTWAEELVDFIKALRELRSGPCQVVAGVVLSKALSTKYRFSGSVDSEGGSLVFRLGGSYAMFLGSASAAFLVVDFPAVPFAIPQSTRFDDLPGALRIAVGNAAGALVDALVRQPEKLALFLAVACGPKAVEFAMELACRGLADGTVVAAVESTWVEAAGIVAAAGAGAAAVPVLSLVQKIAGVFKGVPSAAPAPAGTGGGAGPGAGAGAGPGAGAPAPQPLEAPQFREVEWREAGLHVKWSAVRGASGYLLELRGPADTLLKQQPYGYALEGELAQPPTTLAPGSYLLKLAALQGTTPGVWATRSLLKPALAAPLLHYEGVTLSVAFADPCGGAAAYQADLRDPAGGIVRGERVKAPPWVIKAEVQRPVAGAYSATVLAEVSAGIIPALGPAGSLTVVTLSAPTAVQAVSIAGQIEVQWVDTATPRSRLFRIALLRDAQWLASTTSTSPSARIGPIASGMACTLVVRAEAPDHCSPWSAPLAITPRDVPPPQDIRVTWDADALLVSWRPVGVPGVAAVVYDLRLCAADAPDVVIGEVHGATAPGVPIRPARGDFAAGQRYVASVAAVVPGSRSPWAASSPKAALERPVVTAARYEPPDVAASWLAVETVDDYELAVFDAAGPPGMPLGSAAPVKARAARGQSEQGRVPGRFADGQLVTVAVRVRHGEDTGPWSVPSAAPGDAARLRIEVIAPPGQLTVRPLGDTQLQASWAVVPAATAGYEAWLSAPDATEPIAGPRVATTQASAPLNAKGVVDGSACDLLVRALSARAASLPARLHFVYGPARLERSVRLGNDTGSPVVLAVTDPQGVMPVSVPPGQVASVGPARIAGFTVSGSLRDPNGLELLRECAVSVTLIGPPVSMQFSALAGGALQPGFALRLRRGVRIGGRDLWAEATTPQTLADRLATQIAGPARMAALLRDTWPDARLDTLADALAAAGASAVEAARALAAGARPPGPAVGALAQAIRKSHAEPAASLEQAAAQRARWGFGARRAAPALAAAFPAATSAELATVLRAAFPATTATPLLLACALQAAQRTLVEAGAALHGCFPQADARTLAIALRAACPGDEPLARARALAKAGTPPVTIADQLLTAWPSLTLIQLGCLLVVCMPPTLDHATLASALTAKGTDAAIADATAGLILPPGDHP